MSKVIKVNTDQAGYRKRLINYDRFDNMPSDSWNYEAEIGAKSFRVIADYGDTVPTQYGLPRGSSAVLAIECIDDDTVVVLGAQIPASGATRAGVAVACLAGALGTRWVGDARWLWYGRAPCQELKDKAWFALVRAYKTIVAREKAAAA